MRRLLSIFLAGSFALVFAGEVAAQNTISSRAASIRFGGRLHTQYATSSVDSYQDHFFFRRARLIADITVNDFFDARVQPEFAGGSAELKDAYVRFKFSPGFQVTMGQFKRPFDLFELDSSTDLSLIERDGRVGGVSSCAGVGGICSYSRFTEKLNYSDRDTGIRVGGENGKVSYEVSLTNGTGANVADENDAKSLSGRLSFELSDKITVSGQFARHDYLDDADETAYANAWGADVQYGDWRDGLGARELRRSRHRPGQRRWRGLHPGVDVLRVGQEQDRLQRGRVVSSDRRYGVLVQGPELPLLLRRGRQGLPDPVQGGRGAPSGAPLPFFRPLRGA